MRDGSGGDGDLQMNGIENFNNGGAVVLVSAFWNGLLLLLLLLFVRTVATVSL